MYLAQITHLETQAPCYVNIIRDIINDQNVQSKSTIDVAIREAQSIALGLKDLFTIDNSHYYFITTLLLKYNEKLKNIEVENIDKKVYSEILEILA